jgi:hypothetical protein
VIAQIGRRGAFHEARRALQALHERRHRRDVEARRVEALESDAVGFLLVLAGEVDLHLYCDALRRGDRRLSRLSAA